MSFKFKRFDKSKHDQVEQLIEYSMLLGLNSGDLVAIGNKLLRGERNARKKQKLESIKDFECLPIGKDSEYYMWKRFKLKTARGLYTFRLEDFNYWRIYSFSTKTAKTYHVSVDMDLPQHQRQKQSLLLEIASGNITLDF